MEGSKDLEARLARLELTLLEVVTALGMLVGELAQRKDLALSKPEVVERALETGWDTLFGAVPPPHVPDRHRLPDDAPAALERAMRETGAIVGAIYTIDRERGALDLVASQGYPEEVMAQFATLSIDDDLPVAEVARTGRPLWFGAREEIIEQYPDLLDAQEATEAAIGQSDVQGAVVPLSADGEMAATLLVGFAPADDDHEVEQRLSRLRAALT